MAIEGIGPSLKPMYTAFLDGYAAKSFSKWLHL